MQDLETVVLMLQWKLITSIVGRILIIIHIIAQVKCALNACNAPNGNVLVIALLTMQVLGVVKHTRMGPTMLITVIWIRMRAQLREMSVQSVARAGTLKIVF